ncbi:phosphotransferase family enzyme [Branchiibius hedensis]|uniref:Phosphotransferase enzyme family protein n=1 Tax=Branchiibius hedensis TaxID=672460 RepID=A0A2Y8ZNH4_9MICO|nr:phosphotransferase [Branchiibius hedensis]PWJ25055.1 phosphotransferase family enzyme [Branchiibius hedensis]SSA33870.1 Phosphotransferase enzyme family protein [Branchiibius hedensis]
MTDQVQETVELASTLLGEPLALVGDPLPSGSRHQVLRLRRSSVEADTVVAKRRLIPEPSPEVAALEAFSAVGSTVTPTLVAHAPDLFIMSDLGDHPDLASRMLTGDPLLTRRALLAWATGLARFHRAGVKARVLVPDSLADYMPGPLDEAADDLVTQAADLGVDVRHGFVELRDVAGSFETSLEVLSAGDMCPDNNLLTDEGAYFLDLEFATVRHLAWDLAYLLVPWPSCWCAWRLPPGLGRSALGRWREVFVCDDSTWRAVQKDVELAADAWRWLSISWLLPTLSTGWPERADRPAPPVPDRLCHSLDALARSRALPEYRSAATQLAAAIRRRFTVASLGVVGA